MEEEKRAIEPQNGETPEEKPPFTPSSKSKRIFAWVLFGIVIIAIINWLLCIAIPALERLAKDGGEEGKQKINRITRYVTVALAALQAIGIIAGLQKSGNVLYPAYQNFFGYMTIGVIMAGGTALAMWIGERITKNGIGNGVSLLIFAGIISNLFNGIVLAFTDAVGITHYGTTIWQFLVIIISCLVITTLVTFVDMGERRIPVQYAKRVVGRKMYGGQSTHLPMKVNMSGVMPIIFAQSIASIPATIAAFTGKTDGWVNTWFGTNSIPYAIIYFLLIIFFAYFYSTIQFNPIEVANNLKKNGGYIPGFRPGKPTSEFIQKVLNKITLFGALYLGIIAVVPILVAHFSQSASLTGVSLGGTSIIIVVGVALETVRALEAQMLMRNYKGFLD